MRGCLLILLWLVISFLNFGAENAYLRHRVFYTWYCDGQSESPRHEAVVVAVFCSIPIAGTLLAVLDSGFFEHGFTWKVGPCDAA